MGYSFLEPPGDHGIGILGSRYRIMRDLGPALPFLAYTRTCRWTGYGF